MDDVECVTMDDEIDDIPYPTCQCKGYTGYDGQQYDLRLL